MNTDQKLATCLSFKNEAEEAMNYYLGIFPNSKLLAVTHYGDAGPLPEGTVMTANFELNGHQFMALNGGPHGFNAAISLMVLCKTQEEIDHYWDGIERTGGTPMACGWITDKYGVSWQICPEQLLEMHTDPDPAKRDRAMTAMMDMIKLDLPTLQRAFEGK